MGCRYSRGVLCNIQIRLMKKPQTVSIRELGGKLGKGNESLDDS